MANAGDDDVSPISSRPSLLPGAAATLVVVLLFGGMMREAKGGATVESKRSSAGTVAAGAVVVKSKSGFHRPRDRKLAGRGCWLTADVSNGVASKRPVAELEVLEKLGSVWLETSESW